MSVHVVATVTSGILNTWDVYSTTEELNLKF